ncbi:MAG: nucleotidyltransferase family protein, partial [candidate division Zixibacteria bacterium]|nr:nucleotidyltransferase family protein [candidate division Zixibacteria bacterium]
MNSTVQAYLQLARLLRVDAGGGHDSVDETGPVVGCIDWTNVVKLADKEHMTGALAVTLRRQENYKLLPPSLRGALDRRNLMGAEFNKRLKRQAEEAIRTFNAVGCTPMLLKGALYLFEAPPEELGGRFMRDIDLVVPEESIDTCIRSLREIGY